MLLVLLESPQGSLINKAFNSSSQKSLILKIYGMVSLITIFHAYVFAHNCRDGFVDYKFVICLNLLIIFQSICNVLQLVDWLKITLTDQLFAMYLHSSNV